MTLTSDQLKALLPRVFWLRDVQSGNGTLAALIEALSTEHARLGADVERLYDDLFLATCAPSFIPLIGAGIGVNGLATLRGPGVGDRAWVGRTVALRRAKGMLPTLAAGVSAATGWPSLAEEGRAAVSTTRSVRDPAGMAPSELLRISGRTADPAALRQPWSRTPRSVRASGRALASRPRIEHAGAVDGRLGPGTVAISVWRLASFPVTGRTASPADDDVPELELGRAFRFDPLGRDVQLFTVPAVGTAVARAGGLPPQLPLPLTVDLLREAITHGDRLPVRIEGAEAFVAGDLRSWRRPRELSALATVVDPALGRFLLPHPVGSTPDVDYAYGLAGELGGGPYGTPAALALGSGPAPTVLAPGPLGGEALQRAIAERPSRAEVTIVVPDSATRRDRWELELPSGHELRIVAAPTAAPVLIGDVRVRLATGSRLVLDGLTIAGNVHVDGDGDLDLEHCTVAPHVGRPVLHLTGGVRVRLAFSICGGIDGVDAVQVAARSSIIDGAVRAGTIDLDAVTVFGPVRASTLLGVDSLHTAPVIAADGVVRTSYLPGGSQVQNAFACVGPSAGRPQFTSRRFGAAGYAQLALVCADAIATCATDGGQPGAFGWLGQPGRLARVPRVLHDLLPAGIDASVHYLT